MSTNLPSYQNGNPHQIDNDIIPKSIITKEQTSFKAIQAVVTTTSNNNPQTINQAIGNVRASLAGLSGIK
jgi:hypothetical protein